MTCEATTRSFSSPGVTVTWKIGGDRQVRRHARIRSADADTIA
jgi:hypothetical protein